MKFWQNKYLKIFGLVVLGFGAGFWFSRTGKVQSGELNLDGLTPIKAAQTEYDLIQPLLGYRIPKSVGEAEYADFIAKTNHLIDNAKKQGGLIKASVYLRDLTDNHWAGIAEQDKYEPASLLKVVVMMVYLKKSETDPGLLKKELLYNQKDPVKDFDSESNLVYGNKYSVDELISDMIINSDNGALNTLLDSSDGREIQNFYNLLNLPDYGGAGSDYTISTQTYSLFFRILFNATYLNYADSEKALKLLSQAKFDKGLKAGLPSGVTVAHKFGEHVVGQGGQVTEAGLHDCGIIYYPEHPYLLCVMTLGKEWEPLTKLVGQISQTAYDAIKNKTN